MEMVEDILEIQTTFSELCQTMRLEQPISRELSYSDYIGCAEKDIVRTDVFSRTQTVQKVRERLRDFSRIFPEYELTCQKTAPYSQDSWTAQTLSGFVACQAERYAQLNQYDSADMTRRYKSIGFVFTDDQDALCACAVDIFQVPSHTEEGSVVFSPFQYAITITRDITAPVEQRATRVWIQPEFLGFLQTPVVETSQSDSDTSAYALGSAIISRSDSASSSNEISQFPTINSTKMIDHIREFSQSADVTQILQAIIEDDALIQERMNQFDERFERYALDNRDIKSVFFEEFIQNLRKMLCNNQKHQSLSVSIQLEFERLFQEYQAHSQSDLYFYEKKKFTQTVLELYGKYADLTRHHFPLFTLSSLSESINISKTNARTRILHSLSDELNQNLVKSIPTSNILSKPVLPPWLNRNFQSLIMAAIVIFVGFLVPLLFITVISLAGLGILKSALLVAAPQFLLIASSLLVLAVGVFFLKQVIRLFVADYREIAVLRDNLRKFEDAESQNIRIVSKITGDFQEELEKSDAKLDELESSLLQNTDEPDNLHGLNELPFSSLHDKYESGLNRVSDLRHSDNESEDDVDSNAAGVGSRPPSP